MSHFKKQHDQDLVVTAILDSGESVRYGSSHSTNDDWLELSDGTVIRDYDQIDEYLGEDQYMRITDRADEIREAIETREREEEYQHAMDELATIEHNRLEANARI